MTDNLKTNALIEHLILQNALELGGIDQETGEMLYCITDKLKTVHPGLYEELKQDFEKHMFEMIRQGPIVVQWRLSKEFFNG